MTHTADETPAPRYNIATLLDIAKIPEDRLPVFLSELPRLLDTIRPLVAKEQQLGKEQWEVIAKELTWIDDDSTDGSQDQTTITYHLKP